MNSSKKLHPSRIDDLSWIFLDVESTSIYTDDHIFIDVYFSKDTKTYDVLFDDIKYENEN